MRTRRVLGAAVVGAWLAVSGLMNPANAAIIGICGVNPTLCNYNTGGVGSAAGPFTDDVTFTLAGFTSFTAAASATNPINQLSDIIANWQISLFTGVPNTGVLTAGPVNSVTSGPPNLRQDLSVSGILGPGTYYLEFTGTGGSTAAFTGSLRTSPVPGPIVGAGLPGIVFGCGALIALARRRRQKTAS